MRINTDTHTGQGCFVEILGGINSQLEAMLSYHSRVLVLRLDFHLHDYTPANDAMTKFFRKLKKRLRERYGLLRVGHVWAREIEKAKAQHYHAAIMLDGNKVRHPANVIKLCEAIWERWGHPKPYTPNDCFYFLTRGDTERFNDAFYRLSYMAKARGKGYRSKNSNDYSASRIKNKNELE